MNISFFVSSLGNFQRVIGQMISEEYESQGKMVRPGAAAAGREVIGHLPDGIETIALESCISQINQAIADFPNADEYVFFGFGLSLNIREIVKQFPTAKVYVTRSTESEETVSTNERNKYAKISNKTGISEIKIIELNDQCKSELESFITENNLTYTTIENVLESEFNMVDPTTNTVLQDYNFLPFNTTKFEQACEVAIYKPAK